MRGRRELRWSAAVRLAAAPAAGLVLLAGCGPEFTPLYARAGPGGSAQVVFRACGSEELVREVGLYERTRDFRLDDPPPPLWRITAVRQSRTLQFTVGETPRGWRTRTRLAERLRPDAAYAVVARSTGRLGYLSFRPEQLEPGLVVFEQQRRESVSRFRQRPDTDFGCYPDQR